MHHPALQIVADLIHLTSFFILIWAIHSNRSAEGVSLLTQIFYLVVFAFRYLDIFWSNPGHTLYLFLFKITYLSLTTYIIVLMMKVFPRTREREKAWQMATFCLGGSALGAPLVVAIFHPRHFRVLFTFEVPWTFSIVLESVCILPQLLLLRQTTVPTVISSCYLLTLGSYRAIYIVNWIWRFATADKGKKQWEFVPLLFGVVQTAFYLDFAWVYYSRQRVKLRAGGVVDDDDLRKSWMLRRVLGDRDRSADEERNDGDADENNTTRPTAGGRWGARGISVSADEGLEDAKRSASSKDPKGKKGQDDPHARPGELAGILEGEESDDEDGILPEVGSSNVTDGADEWRDAVPR